MGMLHIEGTAAFREKLSILVSKYIHVFSTTVNTEPARIAPFKIELDVEKWDSLPHERYARPQSQEKQAAMRAFLQKALRDKIIQKSSARQFSQVLLARKKNGTWRFCVDFRRLNLLTKALGWPLQNIESLLIRIVDDEESFTLPLILPPDSIKLLYRKTAGASQRSSLKWVSMNGPALQWDPKESHPISLNKWKQLSSRISSATSLKYMSMT
jgi:hypothetical protein